VTDATDLGDLHHHRHGARLDQGKQGQHRGHRVRICVCSWGHTSRGKGQLSILPLHCTLQRVALRGPVESLGHLHAVEEMPGMIFA